MVSTCYAAGVYLFPRLRWGPPASLASCTEVCINPREEATRDGVVELYVATQRLNGCTAAVWPLALWPCNLAAFWVRRDFRTAGTAEQQAAGNLGIRVGLPAIRKRG